MALHDLVSLIAPPDEPLDVTGDLSEAEQEFQITLPKDYLDFLRRYGTGEFNLGSLSIANLLTEAGRSAVRSDIDTLQALRDACEFPLVVHPQRPGLLPWGSDSNGNIFCWWTEGTPDEWSVVQVGHDDEENLQHAHVPITTFLVNFARNQYPTMLGGRVFQEENYRFERGRPWER